MLLVGVWAWVQCTSTLGSETSSSARSWPSGLLAGWLAGKLEAGWRETAQTEPADPHALEDMVPAEVEPTPVPEPEPAPEPQGLLPWLTGLGFAEHQATIGNYVSESTELADLRGMLTSEQEDDEEEDGDEIRFKFDVFDKYNRNQHQHPLAVTSPRLKHDKDFVLAMSIALG